MKFLVSLAVLLVFSLVASAARAHKPSDAYLTLQPQGAAIEARWDIAVRDLAYVLPLDTNDDGSITWAELRSQRAAIESYALARLTLAPSCRSAPDDMKVVDHSDGAYAVLLFRLACERAPSTIHANYTLFFDVDPQHHGLLRLIGPQGERTAIFTDASPSQSFDLSASNQAPSFVAAVRDGIAHIGTGADHLLFLLALLLPSVLRKRGTADFKSVFRDVLRIVTAFTLAHSITLSLAALDVVRLPSRIVEAGIAASVVLAAVDNLAPILRGERWTVAFALGLLHGFGFSAVLVDLGLAREQLIRVLLGFNLGVELGQCAAVAMFLPFAYWARSQPLYRQLGLRGGSLAIAALATVWLIERAFTGT